MSGLRSPRFSFIDAGTPVPATAPAAPKPYRSPIATAIREGLGFSSDQGTDPVDEVITAIALALKKSDRNFDVYDFVSEITRDFDDRGGYHAFLMERIREAVADQESV